MDWQPNEMNPSSTGVLGRGEKGFIPQVADVVLPTRCGQEIRHRCVMRPDAHQTILLERLKRTLPDRLRIPEM